MPSRYPLFDRSRMKLLPLAERRHDLDLSVVKELRPSPSPPPPGLREAARAILEARRRGAAVIFMMGAHVLRSGVQRYIIDLLERGLVTALAGNGACAIHDFELAKIGATTESVTRYLDRGQFGLWRELGEMNEALIRGAREGCGAGEALGRLVENGDFAHREFSLLAAAFRLGRPFTIHIGIGCDILHEQPNCDGAALGQTSYTDFLIFAREMENLEGGFFGNFGSAVTGPEVYLKALAMARNAAGGTGRGPREFTTLVCDLHELPAEVGREAAKSEPFYYYRPWKTILARSAARSIYVRGRHEDSIPALWTALNEEE